MGVFKKIKFARVRILEFFREKTLTLSSCENFERYNTFLRKKNGTNVLT